MSALRFNTAIVDILKTEPPLQDDSIDLAVTSPPYKRKDGYDPALMEAFGRLIGRVLKPGCRLFMNFGQLREGFARPFEARDIVERSSGLIAGQTIAWIKSIAMPDRATGELVQRGHYQPLNTDRVLNYAWEPIFTYYKPPETDLDRLAIGAPFADKSNMTRGTRGKHGDLHCAGDVWFVPYETTGQKKKKASSKTAYAYGFPEGLVERCIKVSGILRGSVVFDPFLGSGTVAIVAKRLGMHAYGSDIDRNAITVSKARWNAEPAP